ncbi:hypothetical protein Tco_0924393 [Tanacetum coccineum]|uniref:CCHC-type domain-containing protein n=1 Tax=Tanacetum coccineum TaxID=301880 RepID=A0ABQ5DA23_9ASTR
MASHRSKSLYAIKECSTCGRLYTRECCSIGNLEDKILVPVPDSSPRCARCGTPVDGPSCRGCAFLRKEFEEDLITYCVKNGIFQDFQDTSESSDDNTNVVNALREPCVVNQDPGEKTSQGPPQIDQNCCYECGDSLDGIFCRQCICKSCGKGAHFGYNCPPKDPIISKQEPCTQTINEIPQTLPSLDPSCFSLPHVSKPNLVDDPPNVFNLPPHTLPIVHPTCNYENENSFIYNSKPHSSNDFPSIFAYPPQLQFETYLCELCGNDAHYGYDCSPQFPFVYEQEPYYNQNFNNYFPQNSQSYSQQYLCCANCGGPHETFQCQPMNEDYCEQNSCYYPNSSGFDHPQPPQDSVDHQGILQVLNKMEEKLEEIIRDRRKKIEDMSIEEMMHEQQLVDREIKEIINDLGYKRFRGEEIDEVYERDCEIRIRKLKQDFNIWGSEVRKKEKAYEEEKYAAACRYMLSVTCDDEDDYIPLAITTDLPIEEPDNSLNMGDEHLDTIPATESDEVIKSSVENLVPIPSEFEGISDDTCDVPNCDDNCVNVESDFVESLINLDTSIVYSSKINPILEEFAGELAHIAPIPPGIVEDDFDSNDDTSSDDDYFEDTSSIGECSTTTHANYSLPEYESFHFDNLSLPHPPPEPPDIEILKPEINNFDVLYNNESFEPRGDENVVPNVEEDNSFTFVICTFLPFITYPEVSPLSSFTGSEDTIFDPGIFA